MDYDSRLPKDLANLVREYMGKALWTVHDPGWFHTDGEHYTVKDYVHVHQPEDSKLCYHCYYNLSRAATGRLRGITGPCFLCKTPKRWVWSVAKFKRRFPHYEILARYDDHTFFCILR